MSVGRLKHSKESQEKDIESQRRAITEESHRVRRKEQAVDIRRLSSLDLERLATQGARDEADAEGTRHRHQGVRRPSQN